jgi:glycosyltransferase involved in cell wall biosynthesis
MLDRLIRSLLVRYVRARPRRRDERGADRRVTFLLSTAWGMGGTIRTTLTLAGHLASRGYEVEIISVGRWRDRPFFGPFPPGVTVTALDDKRRAAAPSRWHPVRRAARGRDSVLLRASDRATRRGFNLWSDWRLVRALRRRCGVLVTTRSGQTLLATFLAPPGLALVAQEHTHLSAHREGIRRAMKRDYPKLDLLAVLTAADRDAYASHLEDRIRVVHIPNAVRDLGGARADLEAKTALAAGRLERAKGFDVLLETWARVAPDHPDWRLRIYGSGSWRPALEQAVADLGLERSAAVEKPAPDLGAEMSKASIFVLSSRREGFPLVLLEAMSAGMAVVSFDCPTGPADLIDDHRNGLLVPDGDVGALAAGIRELIADADLRRRCAAAAIETAREYTVAAIGGRWEAVLREVWKARTQRRAPR